MYESLYQWVFDTDGPGAIIVFVVGGLAFLGYVYMIRWIYMGRYVEDPAAPAESVEEEGKE
jgi:hypothetical protein